ncbi:MAG: DUF5686 and carboxypeptidase regulatory-like domain-containing protein [Cyclobacteriaceae bacterium]
MYLIRLFVLSILVFNCSFHCVYAQQTSVSGIIKSTDGEVLPFATVYIRNLKTGAASNIEGFYELRLGHGKYDIVFQYTGFESQVKFVEVKNELIELDITLKPQVIILKEIEIRAGREDPSYTIMRKAIAKAKYHTQQLDSYKATVYVKGSGRLIDSPFFLRKQIAKEGIDSTMSFTSESVSELTFQRPDRIEQKVIAVHSQGEDNDNGAAEIITESFYEPTVKNAISPLSPKAFAYYRFEYQGYFMESDYLINKIKVTPRSRGENVFDGFIYIVDDYWSIHSLNLSTTELGIQFQINQRYQPIDGVAWLTISHKVDVTGTFFGFEFEYNYLGTLQDYEITLNPDLEFEVTVIDEKVEEEPVPSITKEKTSTDETFEKLANQKEVSRKDLRKLMREYEKAELEEFDVEDITSDVTIISDSTTEYHNDSLFWNSIRPVPLTSYERKGYFTMDSLTRVEKIEVQKDSTKNAKRKGFQFYDVIVGDNFKISDKTRLRLNAPLETVRYNTVEGYNFYYDFQFRSSLDSNRRLVYGPMVRYSFARKKVIGRFYTNYFYGDRLKRSFAKIEGGKYVYQLNEEEPIHEIVNTFTALLLEENYVKLYEKDYLKISQSEKVTEKFLLESSIEWANRRSLQNNSDHVWFNAEGKSFEDNNPFNNELADTRFGEHQAVILNLNVEWIPWQKYTLNNGRKNPVEGSSPTFMLNYKKGISEVLSSDISFDQLELGLHHRFNWGIRNKFDVKLNAGKFFNKSEVFVDFKHFPGNQTPFATTDPTASFRLLDYYQYSTSDEYVTIYLHDQFRQLLFTQIPALRLIGIKENLFINYLGTPSSNNYTEAGYGLDNIFKVFRIEAIASFVDGKYNDWGIRIGIATNLDEVFD